MFALALALAGSGGHRVVPIALAAILVDMTVQTTLILGPRTVHQLDPAARARLNSAFIAMFFVGGAVGSQPGSVVHRTGGRPCLTALGAALPLVALLHWISEPHRGAAGRPGTASR